MAIDIPITNYRTDKRITLVALPEKEMQRLHDCSASYDEEVFEWEHLGGRCDGSNWMDASHTNHCIVGGRIGI